RDFCVRALSRRLGISEAAVSQHVKVLKKAGLIEGEKRGYFVHYTVNRGLLRDLGRELIQMSESSQEVICPKNCERALCNAGPGCQQSGESRGCMHRICSSDEEE
ncbi:MAG: ArsR/SmtB family transcription factor, partial [Eubacterium sp.]